MPHTLPNTADRNMADVAGRIRAVLRQRRESKPERLPILRSPSRPSNDQIVPRPQSEAKPLSPEPSVSVNEDPVNTSRPVAGNV